MWRRSIQRAQGRTARVGLRVAVVNVWSAANVFRLTAGDQQQRRKDGLSVRTNEELIDCSACVVRDDAKPSEALR